MKKTVVPAFVWMLVVVAIAGTLLIDVGTAGHFVVFTSPRNNKVYAANSVPLIFTVDYDGYLLYTISFYALIEYRLDGQLKGRVEPELTPSSPRETISVNLTALSDGPHWVTVSAYGEYHTYFGNTSGGFGGEVYFTVDTAPPRISILAPLDRTYDATAIPLNFIVREPASWIGYSLDADANVTIAGNTTLSGLSYGAHNLTVYANDIAGNTGSSRTIYFNIAQEDEPKQEPKQPPSFPMIWIMATVVLVAVVGVALLVYFGKIRKTTGKRNRILCRNNLSNFFIRRRVGTLC